MQKNVCTQMFSYLNSSIGASPINYQNTGAIKGIHKLSNSEPYAFFLIPRSNDNLR